MNKILILIVIAIAVVGALVLLNGNKSVQQPNQSANQENTPATITLTDSVFVPKEITVKKGTRVVWINQSGKGATVSSSDHPTHLNYPPLNLGEFGDGSSVNLILNDSGTYGYHDHLNPSSIGTITVE